MESMTTTKWYAIFEYYKEHGMTKQQAIDAFFQHRESRAGKMTKQQKYDTKQSFNSVVNKLWPIDTTKNLNSDV
jgi:hypothetical protein